MKGLDLAGMFNDEIIAPANDMEAPTDPLDLDGDDEAARLRRQQTARLDEQTSQFQRRSDESLLDSMGGAPGSAGGRTFSYADDDFSDDSSGQGYEDEADPAPAAPRGADPSGMPDPDSTGSRDLYSLVKSFEGYNPKAYDDFKQVSIGYGTKARKGETSITKAEAEARLKQELGMHRERVVNHATKHGYKFTDRQLDALTSFDYNTGRLEQLTNNGTRDIATIGSRIPLYNKADGKVLPGLVKRRKGEQALFNQS